MTKDTLNTLLDRSALKVPDAHALVHLDIRGEETVTTFKELRRKVLKAAAAFKARGIKKGDAVALVHRNDPAFVAAYFGLARLGAVAVPINFMVKKTEELTFMFQHCEAKGVLTQKEFLRGVLAAKKECPGLTEVWSTDGGKDTEDFWSFVNEQESFEAADEVTPEDVTAVLYTSGTTGLPKGVMLTHSNLANNVEAAIRAMNLSEKDVALTILPMFHTFAWTACVLLSLRLGCKNVIVSSVTPPKPWLKAMGAHRVTVFAAVPQIYGLLAKQACGIKGLILKYWFFRGVRVAVSGAAPLSPQTLNEFKAGFGVGIIEGYGLTETSPVATINPPAAPRAGSVGFPVEGVEVRVVGEDGTALPEGGEGEIQIRGHNIMKGYLKNDAATREAINPEGWFKSGDIGAIEEGYLYIRDRIKDMIIVKGLKVFSAQVEKVLMEHPDVQEAAVIGIPDDSGDEVIKGYVVLREGSKTEKSDILKFCKKNLDPYKRPRDIDILDELPKNALQKTLKRVLRQQELERKA